MSSTPLRNHENLSKICDEMKTWISHSPDTPKITASSDHLLPEYEAAEIATGRNNPESPDQTGISAGKSDSPKAEGQDLTNNKTSLSEVHEERIFTEVPPTTQKAPIESTSTTLPEVNASLLSAILEPVEHSQGSISDPLSAIKTSSSVSLEGPVPRPLHEIQATVPCPLGLETRIVVGDKSWSISSICPSDHANKGATFAPTLSNKVGFANSDSITRDDIFENCEIDASHHHHDPVKAWLVKHLTSPSLLIPHDEISDLVNSRCDIDPEKGKFLPPILQPETVRRARQGLCEDYSDILWRETNMTTELHIKKELQSRDNMAKTLQMAFDNEASSYEPSSKSDRVWPNAKCIVRPATQLDFAVVAEIVNEENKRTMISQNDERLVIHAEDVARVWDECRRDSRPFIVLTPADEDFLDRSKWPKHSENVYEEFARYMAEHPRPDLPVVGFAFITSSQIGLNDRPCPKARYSGRLNLIVHPDHRHKLYGSALLDRILMSISPFHTSVVDHDWKHDNDDSSGIYEFPASRNIRQYTHLHVEVIESHNKNETDESRIHFLKKFDFEEVGRLRDGSVTEDEQRHMHWQDLVTWARIITPTSKIISRR